MDFSLIIVSIVFVMMTGHWLHVTVPLEVIGHFGLVNFLYCLDLFIIYTCHELLESVQAAFETALVWKIMLK